MVRVLTNYEIVAADNRRMKRFICGRIPQDGTRIVLADGEDGPAWADLLPVWDDDGDCDLLIGTNEPEWANLREVYDYFRRTDLTWSEWKKEAISSVRSRVERVASTAQTASIEISLTDPSATLTVKAAAVQLNCSISFVYKLMYLGELAYEKRGRRRLPMAASILEYRQRNTVLSSERSHRPRTCSHEPYQFKHLFQKRKCGSGR
jgi:excisionase family DNA binding protein